MRFPHALVVAMLLPFTAQTQPDQGTLYQLDPDQTRVRVHLGKSGLLGFMGDNHLIDVPVSEGSLVCDPSSNEPLTLEFTIETGSIKVLDPQLKEETRSEVQKKMAGEEVLDSSAYPLIQFSSTGFKETKEDNYWRIPGNITVKDQTVPMEITAAIQINPSGFTTRGQAELRLTDLGISPPSAGAGAVKVKNLFTVEFESHGRK